MVPETYTNPFNALSQLALALDIVGREEPFVILGLLIIRLAEDRVVGIVVVTVHLVIALLALRARVMIPEIEESNSAFRLERTKVGKVRL